MSKPVQSIDSGKRKTDQSYDSQPLLQYSEHSEWNFEEVKMFENALPKFVHDSLELFENIATRVPGKSVVQIKKHFQELQEDIKMIESGIIPIPNYDSTSTGDRSDAPVLQNKGTWTKEEHELFLMGLNEYGKGDWKSISRHCVMTRTPTQVASHAQKYFTRFQNSHVSQNVQSASSQNVQSASSQNQLSAPSTQFSAGPTGAASIVDQFYDAFSPSY